MNATQNTYMERYELALRTIPAPGGNGCHAALLSVANLGAMAGLDAGTIERDIRTNIPRGSRHVPEHEIRTTVAKATANRPQAAGRFYRPQRQRIAAPCRRFDGPAYRQILIDRSIGADEIDLWELSPMRIDWEPGPMDAVCVLKTLCRPHERLFVGGAYDTAVERVDGILAAIDSGSALPPHIIPNPFTGRQHETKDGKLSYRCDAAVADHRYALVEFDDMPRPDQLAYWHSIITGNLLPVAALIDSGGKSIHAWVALHLPDAAAWDRIVRVGMYSETEGRMRLQGADSQCQNPSRLSRLPGHYREEKKRWQRLLYIDPSKAAQAGTGALYGSFQRFNTSKVPSTPPILAQHQPKTPQDRTNKNESTYRRCNQHT
jgi:hypothetical protein